MINLVDWSRCLCGEDYPEEGQTNPRCPEHNPPSDPFANIPNADDSDNTTRTTD